MTKPSNSRNERLERGQQRRLLVEVAHEELAHLELVAVEEADADQERVGAGAAREPGGLGVEVEQPRPVGDRLAAAAQQGQRGRRRPRARPAAAGAPWRWPSGNRRRTTSTRAALGLLDRALEQVLQRGRPGATAGAESGVFASMRRMTRRQIGEIARSRGRTASAPGHEALEERRARPAWPGGRPRSPGPRTRDSRAGSAQASSVSRPAREQLRQHLEDALGEPDAARLVVVEVDRRRERRRPGRAGPASSRASPPARPADGEPSPSHAPTSRMSQSRKMGARRWRRWVSARSPSTSSSRRGEISASSAGIDGQPRRWSSASPAAAARPRRSPRSPACPS